MRRAWPIVGICVLLFIVAFVYLVPGINQPVNIYDEGIIAYSAVRVMHGDVPYRDFWSIYSPGQFYVLAAAFKLFGASILVERVWDTATRALLAVVAYLLVSRLTSRRLGLLAWGIVTVWVGYYSYSYQYQWVFYGYPAFPAIAFCLLSILLLTCYFSDPRARWLVGSGIVLGVAALFRHDFAIYSGLGQVLALVLWDVGQAASLAPHTPSRTNVEPAATPTPHTPSRTNVEPAASLAPHTPSRTNVEPVATLAPHTPSRSNVEPAATLAPSPSTRRTKLKHLLRPLLPFAASAAVIVLPVALYFLLQARLSELVYDLFTFPTSIFPRFRALPYPPLLVPDNLAFYLPFAIFVLAGGVALVTARRRTPQGVAYALCVLMLILFGLFAFNQARVRADLIHTPAFFLPAVLLIVVLLHGLPQAAPDTDAAEASKVLSALAVLAIVLILPQPLGDRFDLLTDPKRLSPPIVHGVERARTALVSNDMWLAVRYIQQNTSSQDRIYVGNLTHDRVFVNEPMFYFLSERDSATRYHELHPGVATTAPVQTEIAGDLEKYQVKYLVLSTQFEQVREPNESAVSSGVKILDDYIASHYAQVTQFGPYTIWQRI